MPNFLSWFARGTSEPKSLPKGEAGGVDFVSIQGTVRQLEHVGELKGRTGVQTLRRMVDSDPNCQAALNALMLPLTAVEWRVESASDDAGDVELAEKVQDLLFDMPFRTWSAWLEEAIETVLVVGYSDFEPVWDRQRLLDLASRPPETIVDLLTDENGRFSGIQQTLGYAGRVDLMKDAGQCLHLARRVRGGDYYGRSAFRAAYRPHVIGRELEEIANIAVERGAVGVPVGRVPDGDATDGRVTALRKALSKIYTRESVALALPGWAEFLGFQTSSGGTDPKPLLDRVDGLVLRALGVEFLALGMDGGGSLALRRDASSEFVASLRAHARLIKEPINCDLMPWLVLAAAGRGVDPERYPKLVHGSLDVRNVPEISTSLATLKNAGVIGKFTDEDETFVRDLIDLPERDYSEDEDDVRDPPPPPMPPGVDDDEDDEEVSEGDDDGEEADDTEEEVNAGRSFRFSDAGGDGFTSWREPRGAEVYVLFGKIERELDDAVSGLSQALLEVRAKQVDALVSRAEDLFTDPDAQPGDIVDVSVPFVAQMEEVAIPFLRRLYDEGRREALAEARRQGVSQRINAELDRPDPVNTEQVEGFMRASARIIASVLSAKLLESFQHIIRDTLGLGEARLPALREGLEGLSTATVEREARLATSDAMNIGRGAGLEQMEDQYDHFILTELLDTNTCGPCRDLDGEEYATLNDVYAAGRYPPQAVCEGGAQCRGIVVGVARGELDRSG